MHGRWQRRAQRGMSLITNITLQIEIALAYETSISCAYESCGVRHRGRNAPLAAESALRETGWQVVRDDTGRLTCDPSAVADARPAPL
jgi:hypothetical protein